MRVNKQIYRVAIAIGTGCSFSHSAAAATYYYCHLDNYKETETRFITEVLETDAEKIDESSTGFAFYDSIKQAWAQSYPHEGSIHADCYSSSNPATIRKAWSQVMSRNPGARTMPFEGNPVPSRIMATDVRAPGTLTIKTDTSLIDARKEYEQAVLQSQRDDAAARAKQVADTARNQAEIKAKLAKLFEEMRKRGSAQ